MAETQPNLADDMFTPEQRTMQRISALTFWLNRVISAQTDVIVGDSLEPNPLGSLVVALERLDDGVQEWLNAIRMGR